MKSIQPVHTARISVQPRELQIGQVQDLCAIPYQFEQRTITAFIRACCEHIPRPAGKLQVVDPLLWSVNERMNVVIYYLAAMLDDGPDFALGAGHLSDYLLGETDYVEQVEFMHGDEPMICTPLLGYQAEAIEQMVLTGKVPKSYYGWLLGALAACTRGVNEKPLVYENPVAYSKALMERVEILRQAPESEFVSLHEAYSEASLRLQHFVHAVFNKDGILAAQVSEPDAETGVPQLGLARFHPRAGISRGACELLEATDQHQG
ncbi:hypothetical protein [Pseudomonas monteilii]|uniref:hypothetical protein n=1 Tax=Pseudomonas monteilii TaxID=76759 RepID=UPI003F6E1322